MSQPLPGSAWRRLKEYFSGIGGDSTYLWPRWIVLRGVGLVYLLVFAGILGPGLAMIGPHGISPIAKFFAEQVKPVYPGALLSFTGAPSLFWISTSPGMITALEWLGLAAAAALVLNLWPRMALFACWFIFLSFASVWGDFSPAQLDRLVLETALLCIPFAPAGLRPGLGARSPPRPIAIFMMRWMLFRVMFESGLVKIISGDPHWRHLSAMEVMYETSPFPTILGYWDHHLPYAWHLGEIALTFAAELAAPLLAIFAGRRGRWFAFIVWTIFQAGIELTGNFGWLNVASIALGFLLLDDQMLQAAAGRLKLARLGRFLAATAVRHSPSPIAAWRLYGLRAGCWLQFYLTLFFFARICGMPDPPAVFSWPMTVFTNFRSANAYYLYATFLPQRFQVEFAGSNDGGATWRPYDFRYIPQRPDEICPFIAPWFPRFEASVQIACWEGKKSELFPAVASHLLARNPEVMARFSSDPFPDRPALIIRMRSYRLAFTDLETRRKTGNFWRREPAGDYLPPLYVGQNGQIAEFSLDEGDAALSRGDAYGALAIFQRQYKMGDLAAGFRVADMCGRGFGVEADPRRAFAIYLELAREGEEEAENDVGACYEYGIGTPVDYATAAAWYRRGADHGYLLSLYNLGALYAKDRVIPRNDAEGLVLLLEAAARAQGDDPLSRFIRDDQPKAVGRLTARMTPEDIARARLEASERIENGKFR